MKRRLWIWIAVAIVAAGYFMIDVRRRARLDPDHVKRHRTDFTVYQVAAQALKDGGDPYEARNPRGYRYVYPPLLAVLLQPVADWKPENAALVFYVFSVLATIGTVLLLRTVVGGRWPPVLIAAVLCLGFGHQGFQRGQVTHILLFLQVAALAWLLTRRYAVAGLVLGLGAALRLTPLLPAFAVGIGLLAGAFARKGVQPPLRFGGGLAGGLLLGFVLIPVLWLGTERASEVGDRWVEVTKQVYGDNVDLAEDYKINEWRFKNQAPRRVYATWTGWAQGVPFEKERPLLGEASLAHVDTAADVTTWALVAAVFLLALVFLRDTHAPSYAVVYAAVLLLPVLLTRYAWPTHYLMAAPAVALAASGGRRTLPWLVLLAGTLLFYAAHAKVLEPIGQAGCLMLACAVFLFWLLRGERKAGRRLSTILARYRSGGPATRLYRELRLHHGGLDEIAARFPRAGLIVDLGCGAGLLGHVLLDDAPGRRVLAVDHDAARAATVRESAGPLPIEVRVDRLEEIEIPRCMGVALIDVMHYLPTEAQDRVIQRAARALEIGGRLILRDPDARGGLRFLVARLHERIATRFGWTQAKIGRYRSVSAWAGLLEQHGLAVEVVPMKSFRLYADRTVVGRRP